MRKALPALCLGLFLAMGCGGNNHAALKVGPVEISSAEFEEAFKDSRYVHMGETGRKIFLEQYIDTKLILMEAERMGLDKDPEFLKDIQHFWEQALLNRVVAEKNKEFAEQVEVGSEEIQKYYQQHKDGDFQGKPLSEVHDQVKWVLLKIKQSQSFSEWTGFLRGKISIKVNKALLGVK